MLTKLLSLLAQAKGATIAVIVVAGAATATVGATSPQVQDAISNITSTITGASPAPRGVSDNDCASAEDGGGGQPAAVAQRNAAEKLLRDAYNDDHKKLEDMRGGAQGQDNKVVGDIIRTYDDQLRDKLNVALNQVAALTLGREGQVRKADASASAAARPSGSGSATPRASESPRPSASERAEASESPKPSCSPKPSGSANVAGTSGSPRPSSSATTSSASESPRASGSAKPSDQGRVAVAERTTLDADIQKIVDDTVTAMGDLVQQAADAVKNASPAPDHGRPSDNPGNTNGNGGGKPSDQPGGKPSNAPGKP